MKRKVLKGLLFFSVLTLTASLGARPQNGQGIGNGNGNGVGGGECNSGENPTTQLGPVTGVILLPGLPLTKTDVSITDPGTERFYLGDANNAAVRIVDAEDDVWVGDVKGFFGQPGTTPIANRGP